MQRRAPDCESCPSVSPIRAPYFAMPPLETPPASERAGTCSRASKSSLSHIRRRLVERFTLPPRCLIAFEPLPPSRRRSLQSLGKSFLPSLLTSKNTPLITNPIPQFLRQQCHTSPSLRQKHRHQRRNGRDTPAVTSHRQRLYCKLYSTIPHELFQDGKP